MMITYYPALIGSVEVAFTLINLKELHLGCCVAGPKPDVFVNCIIRLLTMLAACIVSPGWLAARVGKHQEYKSSSLETPPAHVYLQKVMQHSTVILTTGN